MTDTFHGVFTPLITPIDEDEGIDLRSLHRLVDFQIERGVHGIWAMGTSAEFASFTVTERASALATVMEAATGRVPVIANVSDASTRQAILHAREAANLGAAAVAATPPYYYPHTQDELVAHYRALAAAVSLPVFIYNIPQTVRVKVELKTAQSLAAEGTVHGIKDSQNDLEWFRQLVLFVRRADVPFSAFAGTRHLIDAAVLAGADGVIPSVANAFPHLVVAAFEAAHGGDFAAASRLQTVIVDIEAVSTSIAGGSRNAQVLGVLKGLLAERGIIASRRLTAPLRNLPDEEWEGIRSRIDVVAAAVPTV